MRGAQPQMLNKLLGAPIMYVRLLVYKLPGAASPLLNPLVTLTQQNLLRGAADSAGLGGLAGLGALTLRILPNLDHPAVNWASC
jgi:hypothetical protein